MKKLLTSVLTLALILCCFTFVGCKKEEDPVPKVATIEETLAICDQFIADMKAIETKISAQDYEYPTTEAVESSTPVRTTDKSSIGIEYSNYMDFDFDYDFKQGAWPEPLSLSYEIYPSVVSVSYVESYFNIYKDNNLQLNVTYMFDANDDGDLNTQYLNLKNNGEQITLSLYMSYTESGNKYHYDFIISLNDDSTWKSFEYKHYEVNDEFTAYMYAEKSTNENRIFNRALEVELETDIFDCFDIDETVQKMICIDEVRTDSMNIVQSKAYNYLESLNIENIINNIDITNAVEIEINID